MSDINPCSSGKHNYQPRTRKRTISSEVVEETYIGEVCENCGDSLHRADIFPESFDKVRAEDIDNG